MFGLGTTELIIILVLVMIIFGAGKLPQVGGALGKGLRNFKDGVKEGDEEKSEEDPEKIDDKDQAGKGNEFPTWQANTTCSTQGTMNFHASSYILGFGFALVNGKLVTSQPDDVGAPDTYEHECSMMDIDDPAVGKQLPCFTYVEQLSTEHQRKYRDMLVKSLAISGQTGEHLNLNLE